MLKKVDPTNPVLVEYLVGVNTSVETGVLLQFFGVGSSKRAKKTKKNTDADGNESPKKHVKSKLIVTKNVKPAEEVAADAKKEVILQSLGC